MRVERWYWLLAFCFVSFCVHLGLVAEGPGFGMPAPHVREAEMVVSLVARSLLARRGAVTEPVTAGVDSASGITDTPSGRSGIDHSRRAARW